jgi:hypothetical protein
VEVPQKTARNSPDTDQKPANGRSEFDIIGGWSVNWQDEKFKE